MAPAREHIWLSAEWCKMCYCWEYLLSLFQGNDYTRQTQTLCRSAFAIFWGCSSFNAARLLLIITHRSCSLSSGRSAAHGLRRKMLSVKSCARLIAWDKSLGAVWILAPSASAPVIGLESDACRRCVGFDVSIHLSESPYCRCNYTIDRCGLQIGSFRVCGNLIAAGDFNAHACDAALELDYGCTKDVTVLITVIDKSNVLHTNTDDCMLLRRGWKVFSAWFSETRN